MNARSLAGLLLAALLLPRAPAQDPGSGRGERQGGGFSFAPTMLRAADKDGDGDVGADEWATFIEGLADAAGAVDGACFKARMLLSSLDADRDGVASVVELDQALSARDVNGDGSLSAEEISPGGRGGRGGGGTLWLRVAIEACDASADGVLGPEERDELLQAVETSGEAGLPEALAASWVRRVESSGSGDRTEFTPAMYLSALGESLDADRDGSVTGADLARLFAGIDADGNGVVAAGELSAARRGGAAGGQDGAAGNGRGGGQDAGAIPFQRVAVEQRDEPPLIPWQRNLEDALSLVESTGRPLLICVNMDGEPASESLAWFRYRDQAFAQLVAGFVPLIVSPDRHSPIDHDDRGRRIPDPRFGRVIDAEHIDIEPALYERYFNGNRVAPRHVGVAPDGAILFDLFLLGDLSEVDAALGLHGRLQPIGEAQVSDPVAGPGRADEPAAENASDPFAEPGDDGHLPAGPDLPLESSDAADREQVEASYLEGDWRLRFRLASSALDANRKAQHPELLRLALRDEDGRVRRQAVWTVVREPARSPPELYPEALRVASEERELRGALTGALGRLARTTQDEQLRKRAERLHGAFAGLALRSRAIDVERWSRALSGVQGFEADEPAADELDGLLTEVGGLELQVRAAADDAQLRLRQAERLLRLGRLLFAAGDDPSEALADAREAALAAQALHEAGDPGGRAAAVLCYASYLLGESEAAAEHGALALPGLIGEAGSPLAFLVLHVVAQARLRQLYTALRDETSFPAAWVADVRDAYEVLLAHPGGTDRQAVEYLGFLGVIEAWHEQSLAVRRALERFPDSGDLHAWLRTQKLRDEGAVALEAAYADLRERLEDSADLRWYHALALLLAAERHVGNRDPAAALDAYQRSVALFRSSIELQADFSDSALHYVCLARAGQARLHAEAKRWAEALGALREALAAHPASATVPDGLGHTAAETATLVQRGLESSGHGLDASQLREAFQEAGVVSSPRPEER